MPRPHAHPLSYGAVPDSSGTRSEYRGGFALGAIADMSAVWLFILRILQTDLVGPLSPGSRSMTLEHAPIGMDP